METKHNITVILREGQIQTAIASLDIYFRIFLGQYDAIDLLYQWNSDPYKIQDDAAREDLRDDVFVQLRDELAPDISQMGLGGSRGIYNEQNDPRCMDAYNLMCSIRSEYAWYKHPAGGGAVDFRSPTKAGRYPHAKCEVTRINRAVTEIVEMIPEQYTLLSEAADVYEALLCGRMREVFSHYTEDPEMLELAAQTERFHPRYLMPDVVRDAGEYRKHIASYSRMAAVISGGENKGKKTKPSVANTDPSVAGRMAQTELELQKEVEEE